MSNFSISVCATCYNHERYLPEFVESIQSQDFRGWELIVVDDCSTDKSFELLQAYAAKDTRIKPLKNDKNRHMCYSGNRAADLATGELITVISCDDVFLPGKIRHDVEFMADHPGVAALYTEPKAIVEDGTKSREFPLPSDFSRISLLQAELFGENVLTVPGLTLRREAWNAVGGYHPLLRMTQDHELHLKILEHYEVARSQMPTVGYRLHGRNLSQRDNAYFESLANENVWLLSRHYLNGIFDVELVKALVPEYVEYGELTPETTPFFLARHAISVGSACVRSAGYLALLQYMSDNGNRDVLEKTCDFLPKDLMRMAVMPGIGAAQSLERTEIWLDGILSSKAYAISTALTWPVRFLRKICVKGKGS